MSEGLFDVAIIGGGPSGLAAAAALGKLGIKRVAVIERDAALGGVPRHCGHPPFGMREFGRVLTGPSYAARLSDMARASGAEIMTSSTVTGIEDSGTFLRLILSTPEGLAHIYASRVLLATGTRESPRSARLASGERPLGVINTGALQAYAYLEHLAPFKRPLIIGTELVALFAILTCRSIGARPVAMIEENPEPTAPKSLFYFPKLLGIPVLTATRLVDIAGSPRVTHVTIEDANGKRRDMACDGVIFTGKFTPEAHLARIAGLKIDAGTGGPEVDQFGRTSHARIYATGNLLRPVETAGWSFREGTAIAATLARDLSAGLGQGGADIPVRSGPGIKYSVPQRLASGSGGAEVVQLRVSGITEAMLVAKDDSGAVLYSGRLKSRPERRITIPLAPLLKARGAVTLTLSPSRDS